MLYNIVVLQKSSVTELSLGINTDCSSLIPKPHPHPRKKGLLFTVWTCDFPTLRLPYSHDVKNLYYCYPVCAVFLINDGFQLLSLIACFAIPFSRYPCTCLQSELVAFILSVYKKSVFYEVLLFSWTVI